MMTPDSGVDQQGRTPLWYHAANGEVAVVASELAGGADPNLGDQSNYSPLHVAVQNGRIEVIQLLLEAGGDPNKIDTYGNGPLWTAVLSAPNLLKLEIITLLLKSGANPDHKNRADRSPRDAANQIAHGLEVPFSAYEVRISNSVKEPTPLLDEQTEIPLQNDSHAIAKWVWKNLVPVQGQSAWIQGELLRCIEKFRWEARNNGNQNWDQQFKMLANYLEKTLCAESAFSTETKLSIEIDMNTIRKYNYPYTENDLYDRLVNHVVEYCRLHPLLISKPHNPRLKR